MTTTDYVYTIAAVRARLRRNPGCTVMLFWPNSGRLVEVTEANLQQVIAQWKAAGNATRTI